MTTVCFDFETPIKNKGNAFTASNKSSISYSVKVDNHSPSFNHFTQVDYLEELRASFQQAKLLIGFNIKFDLHWASKHKIHPQERCRVWDTQLAEFILMGQKGSYPSLDECCAKYNLGTKDDKIAEYWKMGICTEFIPKEELEFYNNLDVDLTYKLYLAQKAVMTDAQLKLLMVAGLDLLVLQEMEENGVKFDTTLCTTKAKETKERLDQLTEELLKYSPSPDINLDSGQHLSCLLYGGKIEIETYATEIAYYKSHSKATGARKGDPYTKSVCTTNVFDLPKLFAPLNKSETKLKKKLKSGEEITIYVTNEDTLKQLRCSGKYQRTLIQLLLERAELAKLLDTYYGKLPSLLETMEWGNYLHGQYNQCVAATGRLSSSAPNMQNFSGDVDGLLISRYD